MRTADMEEKHKYERIKKGGFTTMPFIFANEACEKLASAGFNANMLNYLTEQLHLPLTKSVNTLTTFGGTASFTPFLGAFISDAYVGRFWTITVASIIYLLGMMSLTVSAILPGLKPPVCNPKVSQCMEANSQQMLFFYLCAILTAIGSGGIRPCSVGFGMEQLEDAESDEKSQSWRFFNWYYFFMGVSILIVITVIVYIQDNIGWGWGLGIPTGFFLLSIITFVSGYPLYIHVNPSGSPFTRMAQVIVAAYRKRKLPAVTVSEGLYVNNELDTPISTTGRLLHTLQFRFLDKAAVVTEEDDQKNVSSSVPNLWRLNTVHRVEELKTLIRMFPIWVSGIPLIAAYVQQGTFTFKQATTMDRHLTPNFQIPAASMYVFTITSMLATIVLYDRLFVKIMRRLTKLDRGITFLQRMAIGFAISILATLVAAFVEVRRKTAARDAGLLDSPEATVPISVFWLVPQYALHGIAEAFMSVGHLEFFTDQSPESLRSTATALFCTAGAFGNYLSTLMVFAVHRLSNWLPDKNLNRGRLEYFYWLVTGLQIVNFIYYLFCAKMYTLKPLEFKRDIEMLPNGNKD